MQDIQDLLISKTDAIETTKIKTDIMCDIFVKWENERREQRGEPKIEIKELIKSSNNNTSAKSSELNKKQKSKDQSASLMNKKAQKTSSAAASSA